MADATTTINELKALVRKFIQERDWQQFHNPKNLTMNIAIEAAELMEIYQWLDMQESVTIIDKKRTEIENEVADIAHALLNFCDRNSIDLSEAMKRKMVLNEQKYPIDKAKGNRLKHTDLS